MDPQDNTNQAAGRVEADPSAFGPVVRKIVPGGSPSESGGAPASMPSPARLAGAMRLTAEERSIVDRLLPDITSDIIVEVKYAIDPTP